MTVIVIDCLFESFCSQCALDAMSRKMETSEDIVNTVEVVLHNTTL